MDKAAIMYGNRLSLIVQLLSRVAGAVREIPGDSTSASDVMDAVLMTVVVNGGKATSYMHLITTIQVLEQAQGVLFSVWCLSLTK